MELLERQAELVQLDQALADALSGRGRVVLVTGEAGIGKTTLVEHFVEKRPADLRLWWGGCEPLHVPRPYGPIHDIAAAVPELEAPLAQAADLAGLQRAFLSALERPTLVAIEDLHWADEATLALLRGIAPALAGRPVLLILTIRDDEQSIAPLLRSLLNVIDQAPTTSRIPLAPLTEQAVRTLAGADTTDTAALYTRTGGNPFFVTEALATPEGALPPSVRDAVLARANRLTRPARATLEAAAVIGPRVERWLLSSVSDANVPALQECQEAGLLLDQGEGLVFRHELARQAILESIPLTRTLNLHRQALTALSAQPESSEDWSRLAHHAVGAGDGDAIWRYAQEAGRQAAWARAHGAAVTWFEQALAQASGRPEPEAATLLDAYGQECDTVDRRVDAIAARERAAALWSTAGDQARLGNTLAQLAVLFQLVGRMPDAIAANSRALAALETLAPNEALISAYNTQAWLFLGSGAAEAGSEVAQRAIALAEQMGSATDLPRLTEVAGLCELNRDYARGIALLERSLKLALAHDLMTRAGNTYANLGSIYVDFHDFHKAAALQTEGMDFARKFELGSVYAFMEGWQAVLQVHRGEWSAAETSIESALRRPPPSPARGTALLALGRLRTRRGQPDAFQALDESLEILQRQGFRQREGLIRAARAEAAWEAGDHARLFVEVEAGLELALRHQQPWYVGELAYWAWRAGRVIALPAWTAQPYALQIAGAWREAATAWHDLGCPFEEARARADGDPEARLAALEIFESLGALPAFQAVRRTLPMTEDLGAGPEAIRAMADLTPRQAEVLSLVAAGLTNAEIASRLRLSVKTVDHHVAAILARLDVRNREEAVQRLRAAPPPRSS